MSDAQTPPPDYKSTLYLPTTDFPMKANLAQREPEQIARWEAMGIYGRLLERREGAPRFLLHDGPPYANGRIHIGHALNKVLKDIVVKYKTMRGHGCDYVPGWDCHGLPIEWQVEKELGAGARETSRAQKRRLCRAYAEKYVAVQKEEFRRLGVFGRWDRPYLTMDPKYQAAILEALAEMVARGLVYRKKRPVHWDWAAQTALAEAEIEYAEVVSPAIYVKFALPGGLPQAPSFADRTFVVIWTTTPWTLPANLAVALHPEFDYAALRVRDECWIVADGRVEPFAREVGLSPGDAEVLARFPGAALAGRRARHPWIDRDSAILTGDHVTREAGTGCVHTAPGHGQDDYRIGVAHGLAVYSPVDDRGRFTAEVPEFEGRFVFDADADIIALLEQRGRLVHRGEIRHAYPHSWRSRKPILFRATDQWWLSMDGAAADGSTVRSRALKAIGEVDWIPAYGRERLQGMMESRPDWCLSRQRAWGVPIPAVHCARCNAAAILRPEAIRRLAGRVADEGVEAWFSSAPSELGLSCPECGSPEVTAGEDILDVWFDSGVSHYAVCERRGLGWPADLYLEGSDQHRGWFNSSLTTAAAMGRGAPYRRVLTHGFVLDGQGRAMSKSMGNVIAPQELIRQSGADILRLWIGAEDYRDDVRISPEILSRMGEAYRRIRNTARFLLGGLADFDPAADAVGPDRRGPLDRYLLHLTAECLDRVTRAFEAFEFHRVHHLLQTYCAVDLSAFYLDIVKDRLYCDARASPRRRSCQTVLAIVLDVLARMMAPVLPFTAEEIWSHRKRDPDDPDSVHLADWPAPRPEWREDALAARWEPLRRVRKEVSASLEGLRAEKRIGHSLEAGIHLMGPPERLQPLQELGEPLEELFIVSRVGFGPLAAESAPRASTEMPGLFIGAAAAPGAKCARCWQYRPEVERATGDLCNRCREVVHG